MRARGLLLQLFSNPSRQGFGFQQWRSTPISVLGEGLLSVSRCLLIAIQCRPHSTIIQSSMKLCTMGVGLPFTGATSHWRELVGMCIECNLMSYDHPFFFLIRSQGHLSSFFCRRKRNFIRMSICYIKVNKRKHCLTRIFLVLNSWSPNPPIKLDYFSTFLFLFFFLFFCLVLFHFSYMNCLLDLFPYENYVQDLNWESLSTPSKIVILTHLLFILYILYSKLSIYKTLNVIMNLDRVLLIIDIIKINKKCVLITI